MKADLLIEDIFKDTASIPITTNILGLAKNRVEIGNSPGKPGSMGDAVNWEAILHSDEMVFEDLNIVSIDKDFASPLDENELNPFLKREYEAKHYGNVRLFRSLMLFLESNVPEIVLSTPNEERTAAVIQLCNSRCFATTHVAIADLLKFSEFEIAEVEQLLDAVRDNSQVGLISGDPDVDEFFRGLISRYRLRLTRQRRQLAAELFPEVSDKRIEE